MLPRERVEVDGVMVDRIPRDVEIGLLFLIPTIEAQRTIASGKYNHRDAEGVYSLFMLAYDNPRIASDAQLNALKAIVDESRADQR